jgi:hypothetical protein
MSVNSLVRIGGSCLSTLILWQTLFETQVSKLVLLLRMVLFALEALTGIAMVRTHPKATNFDNYKNTFFKSVLTNGLFLLSRSVSENLFPSPRSQLAT